MGVGRALGMMGLGNKPVARKRARLGGRSFGGVLSTALGSGIMDAKSREIRCVRRTELRGRIEEPSQKTIQEISNFWYIT